MVHEPNWAHTALGLPIALHASLAMARLAPLRPILLIGGVHGDEPEGVWLARACLHYLQSEAQNVRAPWVVIPCLNADGLARQTRVNGRGVDLNRNYPARNWSPQFDKERYHPGEHPGSEPEIQAVIGLLELLKPRLVIHCHSWEPCIVYTGEPAQRDAERLARASGYAVRTEIGYPTPGALSQFAWNDRQIPVICIEERSGAPEADVWSHFAAGIREIFADGSMRSP